MAVVVGGRVVGAVSAERAGRALVAHSDMLPDGGTVNRREARVSAAKDLVGRALRTGREWRIAGDVAGVPVLVEIVEIGV